MHLHELLQRVLKEERDFFEIYRRKPTAEQVAKAIGITTEKVVMIKNVSSRVGLQCPCGCPNRHTACTMLAPERV